MDILILGARSALAVRLLVAAGAKLSDPAGFAAAVRLFLPLRLPRRLVLGCALGIALAELVLGTASLSSPAVVWLNPVIFALACAFVAVSAAGFAFHRGRACKCFGTLSHRNFDAWSVLRSVGIAALAAVGMWGVHPASVQVGPLQRLLLFTAALLLALVASTAARSLAVAGTEPRSIAK